LTHSEFNHNGDRRAFCEKDFVDDSRCNDENGHGTHVAGVIGGVTYGVAKKANLRSLKVCKGTGSCAKDAIVAALERVVTQTGKRVVNISLSGDFSQTIEKAKQAVVDSGAVVVVAAGNSNTDACITYANSAASISVGATTRSDTRASFSNYGSCVDIWAPGQEIKSSTIGGPLGSGSFTTLDGTSFAAPHVTGIVALQLERGVDPSVMSQVLREIAVDGVLTGLGNGSPNLLVHMPLGLDPVLPICPPEMIERACRTGSDCCEGYACEKVGLLARGKCARNTSNQTCISTFWRSTGKVCLIGFMCCSKACRRGRCT